MSTASYCPSSVGKPHIKPIICQDECQRFIWRIEQPCCSILSPTTTCLSSLKLSVYSASYRNTSRAHIQKRNIVQIYGAEVLSANRQKPMLQQNWWPICSLIRPPHRNPLHTENITIFCCYLNHQIFIRLDISTGD
jgi:hypothetical protein